MFCASTRLRCGIEIFHRSVSDSARLWEYARCSVRDMVRSGFSRLARVAIISIGGRLRPRGAILPLAVRELATMATSIQDNVPTAVPSAQDAAAPKIRTIGLSDLHDALRLGWEDFKVVPSHAIILCLIYPVLGLVLARTVHGYSVLPLLFPLAAGFALLGPFAAIGFYEISREREQGLDPSWWSVFSLLRSKSRGSILALGALLMVIFFAWTGTAEAIYKSLFGDAPVTSLSGFVHQVFET